MATRDRNNLLHHPFLDFLLLLIHLYPLIINPHLLLMSLHKFRSTYKNLLFLLKFYELFLKLLGFFDFVIKMGDVLMKLFDVGEVVDEECWMDFFGGSHYAF